MKQPLTLAKRRLLSAAILLGGVGIDQLTKLLAVLFLKGRPSLPLWQGVLHLTYVENQGAAFGILSEQRWVFMVFSTVAIVALAAYLFFGKEISPLSAVALSMIVSGGVGNMIDRLFRSATDALGNVYYFVVDFIDFTLIDFAVFNGADSFVCVGAGLMILSLFLEMKQEMQKAKAEKTAQEEASQTEEDE
ncbi:MAG: signal peptidase II [Clostridia bacterium]|nr:signal peptidase II [Clostridia bacterium]